MPSIDQLAQQSQQHHEAAAITTRPARANRRSRRRRCTSCRRRRSFSVDVSIAFFKNMAGDIKDERHQQQC